MSRNARIEEVSDSEPESDPDDMDPSDYDPTTIIRPLSSPSTSNIPPSASASSFSTSARHQTEHLIPQPHHRPLAASSSSPAHPPAPLDKESYQTWHCLYPVYFDRTRSRAEGRRVSRALAVANPLAREIADAVQLAGFDVVFEPAKMHPKDWANPGRIRFHFKDGDGVVRRGGVRNKHHLYTIVAKHLQAHPTTEDSPLRLRIHGIALPDKTLPPPAAPRGWKIGTILPLHSPAVSGGGVSENIFKDMMAEMQGRAGGPVVESGDVASGNEGKKSKKKKIKA